MIEERYVHPDGQEDEFTLLVYLEKGDRHEFNKFMSFNEGCVFIHDAPTTGTHWYEFDKDAPQFLKMVESMKAKGWVLEK